MNHSKVTELGMELERWTHESCEADFATGDDWASLYSIESKEKNQGYATELMRVAKIYYETQGLRVGGTVPLNDAMEHLYKKMGYEVFAPPQAIS